MARAHAEKALTLIGGRRVRTAQLVPAAAPAAVQSRTCAANSTAMLQPLSDNEIRATPAGSGDEVKVGKFGALLPLADNKSAASTNEAARSIKLVAGRGFEPLTFRL